MCRCTPSLRTPWCGKPGCEAPAQKKPPGARADPIDALIETGTIPMQQTPVGARIVDLPQDQMAKLNALLVKSKNSGPLLPVDALIGDCNDIKVTITDADALRRITPEQMTDTVQLLGWRDAGAYGPHGKRWTRGTSEVVIPTTTEIADYVARVSDVVRDLAEAEKWSQLAIYRMMVGDWKAETPFSVRLPGDLRNRIARIIADKAAGAKGLPLSDDDWAVPFVGAYFDAADEILELLDQQDEEPREPATIAPVAARSDYDPGLACLAMLLGDDYDATAARFPYQPGRHAEGWIGDPLTVWTPDIVWVALKAGAHVTTITPRERVQGPMRQHGCAPASGELWPWLAGRRAILLVPARHQEDRVSYVFWDGTTIIDPQFHRRPANHYQPWERMEILEAVVRL